MTSELDVSPVDGAAEMRQGWIEKVASTLLSYRESAEPVGAPNEMISDAAHKAFKVSTALGLIPGPLGVAAILPEVAVLTRLQINLIYRIAKYHGRDESADSTIVLLILANVLGVAGGEVLIRRAGSTLSRKVGELTDHQEPRQEDRHPHYRHGRREGSRPLDPNVDCSLVRLSVPVAHPEDRERGGQDPFPADSERCSGKLKTRTFTRRFRFLSISRPHPLRHSSVLFPGLTSCL